MAATAARSRPRKSARPAWMEKPRLSTQTIKAIILIIIAVVMLYPFLYVIFASLSDAHAANSGELMLWPRGFNVRAYEVVFDSNVILKSLIVSVSITLIGTACSMIATTMLAYGLSRTREVPFTRGVLLLVLITMLYSVGLIPGFLMVKYLGLLNHYAALIVPMMISAFNMVVIRNFFMNIPRDLIDSARIDGASELQILWRIVIPLSKAVLAVVALFYGVGYWNDFFSAVLYLNDSTKWPVQLVLRQFVLQGNLNANMGGLPPNLRPAPANIQMAVVVVATVPILLVYPFLQRFFTKGVLTGAIKG